MNENSYASLHTHTDYSNLRLKDAINRVEDLIDESYKLGLNGVVITDHETLSAHVKAKKHYLKHKDELGDFKVGFGNEIYLVDRKNVEILKEKNEKIIFNHFILIAKNKHGYDFLKKQTTHAWGNEFSYRGMSRVPTYYDWLEETMKEYKGDVIASSACLGGQLPHLILEYHQNHNHENYQKIIDWLSYMVGIFGKENFYLEMQPSNHEDQQIVNDYVVKISKALGLKYIITTDAHYLSLEQKEIHKIYLKSTNEDRDVDSFYDTTYLMSANTVRDFFKDDDVTSEAFKNTNDIISSLEDFDFEHSTLIPKSHIPNFEEAPLSFYNNDVNWDKYEFIKMFINSKTIDDRYYIKLILDGMINHEQEFNDENLSRINTELDVVQAISENFGMPMSSYFLVDKEFVDIMWEVSLVGVARGSASCFYTNYLIDIVQINPLKYDLPYWRFLNKDRLDNMPDIDLDTEGSKRSQIIELVKKRFGEDSVINAGTFSTEGVRSSVLTASRGIGLDVNTSNNILDLLPNEKGNNWPLEDAFFGNEKKHRKPALDFIKEVEKYEGLKETLLGIQGLISGRSQHASGVFVMTGGYDKWFGMMKTTGHLPVSQLDAHDVEYVGGIKFDFLSINALDRVREAMKLLVNDKKIDEQETLKLTYDKYFHPDVISINNDKLYDILLAGDVPHVFQFDTQVGRQGILKVQPRNFDELAATNSLIRLTTEGKQPIDKYVDFKNNPQLWYEEMDNQGLTKDEQAVLSNILSPRYGICDTQEYLMMISMDEHISNFSLKEANGLRKSVAKKDPVLQQKEKEVFFLKCEEAGTSYNLAQYVWNFCIVPQFGYAFSLPHIVGYTLIAEIEMNIALYYGDIYWKTACLSVDAGVYGDTFGGIDYASISSAIVNMIDIVETPSVNTSGIGFLPRNNKILFGLGSIAGINNEDINSIINGRPYDSFDDFISKNDFSVKKIITIIKSGMFNEFGLRPYDLAIKYLEDYTPRKNKLTTVQLPKIINYVPDELKEQKIAYIMKTRLFGRNKVEMNDKLEKAFLSRFKKYDIDYSYEDGVLVVDEKSFNKWFNKFAEGLKNWLKTDEAIEALAKFDMIEVWNKECEGNEESWYFSTLSFYPTGHELLKTPLYDMLGIKNFGELKSYKDARKAPKSIITGTVVDKDKKGIVFLVTPDNHVVTVRVGKGKFPYYNKKVMEGTGKDRHVIDNSWFDRGTKLIVGGFKRGSEFVANNKGLGMSHSLAKIHGYDNDITLQSEKF